MSEQNILTGSKLCWDAILRLSTIYRPDEICFMDGNGVTVKEEKKITRIAVAHRSILFYSLV